MLTKRKLSEVATIVMGQSPEAEYVSEEKIGLPLLNGPAEFTERYPIPVQFASSVKRIAEKDDILFCVRGSTTGRMNIADQRYAIGRGLAGIRHKNNPKLNPYIKALIEVNLRKLLGGTLGSVFPNLTKDNLFDLECQIHDENAQQKIAKVLSDLDAKIELNNRINAELEAMAKLVYEYWFVQFDFPFASTTLSTGAQGKPVVSLSGVEGSGPLTPLRDRASVAERSRNQRSRSQPYKSSGGKMVWNEELKREIPEGWRSGNIMEIADFYGGGTPKTNVPDYWNGEYNFYTPADYEESIFSLSTKEKITEKGLENCNSKLFKKGTIFITARGSVGKINVASEPMAMNQSCYALFGKRELGYPFVFQHVTELVNYIKAKASGSIFNALVTNDFKFTKLPIPPDNLIEAYNEKALSLFEKILANKKQNQQLSSLRDWLLPMLMNGQVSVAEAEERVEEELGMVAEPEREEYKSHQS